MKLRMDTLMWIERAAVRLRRMSRDLLWTSYGISLGTWFLTLNYVVYVSKAWLGSVLVLLLSFGVTMGVYYFRHYLKEVIRHCDLIVQESQRRAESEKLR
jgi:hypothetical protein